MSTLELIAAPTSAATNRRALQQQKDATPTLSLARLNGRARQ